MDFKWYNLTRQLSIHYKKIQIFLTLSKFTECYACVKGEEIHLIS